jgi:hypothetical protein
MDRLLILKKNDPFYKYLYAIQNQKKRYYIYNNSSKMKLVILEEYEKVCEWAAQYIKKRINQFAPTKEKLFVLGLPTGKSKYLQYTIIR